MKYALFLFLALALAVSACLSFNGGGDGEDGGGEVFEGSGMGYRGPISVLVRINDGSITEMTVIESVEDRQVGEAAMEELIELIIECNSADIDVISGATMTSKGFIEAVKNAIISYYE
jgi:urocanate reductase